MKDQINNFRNISEDAYWPSWKKGQHTREKISEFLRNNPNASITEIAESVEISTSQVRRHRQAMVCSGILKICTYGIFLSIAFGAGAYYADRDLIDEWIDSRIKLPTEELRDEIIWKIQQQFL